MYITGQKPGKGTYQCINCGTNVTLDDNTDTLPLCPKCNKTDFIKV
jgi:DNA-directed RNA polymerase subunit RPC12/RpoP